MFVTDEEILGVAQAWMEAGLTVALATVVKTWGSAPRPVGSHLIIDSEGNFLGSVSGGCVEADVVTEAFDVISSGLARILEFGVANEVAWRAGLSCGGRISIYLEKLNYPILQALNSELKARRVNVLVKDMGAGEQRLVLSTQVSSDPLARILEEYIRLGKSGMVEVNGKSYFLLTKVPSIRLILIGAVHISQALAPMAKTAGFDVIIIDPRTAFATLERFPDVRIIAEWPQEILPQLGVDRFTGMVMLTHDPRIDDPALSVALSAGCIYVGALGSKKTHRARLERLQAAGFDDIALRRIHAPIGSQIGAVTPSEIAVAILAELISALRLTPVLEENAAA